MIEGKFGSTQGMFEKSILGTESEILSGKPTRKAGAAANATLGIAARTADTTAATSTTLISFIERSR